MHDHDVGSIILAWTIKKFYRYRKQKHGNFMRNMACGKAIDCTWITWRVPRGDQRSIRSKKKKVAASSFHAYANTIMSTFTFSECVPIRCV